MRGIDCNILIRSALRGIDSNIPHVFDSIRYESDYSWFKDNGYELWKIDCPRGVCIERLILRGQIFADSDLEHASELELSSREFHRTIRNFDTTIEELARRIGEELSLGP